MKRVLLCMALIAWSGLASAIVYKWVGEQGKIQYGDRPPDGVHAEIVQLLGTHYPRAASDARAAPARSSAPLSNEQTFKTAVRDPSGQDNPDARKAVAQDLAQVREKQCADAQDRYKKLIEGRRIFKAGADGERQYLTAEEIDAARVEAKRDVDSVCNNSG